MCHNFASVMSTIACLNLCIVIHHDGNITPAAAEIIQIRVWLESQRNCHSNFYILQCCRSFNPNFNERYRNVIVKLNAIESFTIIIVDMLQKLESSRTFSGELTTFSKHSIQSPDHRACRLCRRPWAVWHCLPRHPGSSCPTAWSPTHRCSRVTHADNMIGVNGPHNYTDKARSEARGVS